MIFDFALIFVITFVIVIPVLSAGFHYLATVFDVVNVVIEVVAVIVAVAAAASFLVSF